MTHAGFVETVKSVDFKKYVEMVRDAIRETNREFGIDEELPDELIAEYEDRMLLKLKPISRELYRELARSGAADADAGDVDVNVRLMLPLGMVCAAWAAYALKMKSRMDFGDPAEMGRMADGMAGALEELVRQALAHARSRT